MALRYEPRILWKPAVFVTVVVEFIIYLNNFAQM